MTKEIVQPSLSNPQSLREYSGELKKFIVEMKLFTPIQGKNYVNVEGWQFAGMSMGLLAIVEKCERMDRKDEVAYRAEVALYQGEKKVGYAMAICSNKENKKKSFDEYAVASMAQTRAVGKAYRLLLAPLMKMAGYEGTPAEDAPSENGYQQKESKQNPGKSLVEIRKMIKQAGLTEGKICERFNLACLEDFDDRNLKILEKSLLEKLTPAV